MLSPAQIALRRNGIGSSDIASIVGVSFWGDGPHKVYLAKRYGLEQRSTLATRLGDAWERALEPEYERETGVRLARLLDAHDTPATLVHPDHPWVMASPDRLRVSDLIPVEIKFILGERAHYHHGEPEACDRCGRRVTLHWGRGPEEVPDDVAAQVQWQMLVTGATWMHVVRTWPARGEPELRIHTVAADPIVQAYLFREGERFWHEHVIPGIPPDPDGSDYSTECERRHAANVLNRIVDAPAGAEDVVRAYSDADAMVRKGQAKKARAANTLRRLVGIYDGINGDGFTVTNKVRVDGVRALRVKAKADNVNSTRAESEVEERRD